MNYHGHEPEWFEYDYDGRPCRICRRCDAIETQNPAGEWEDPALHISLTNAVLYTYWDWRDA